MNINDVAKAWNKQADEFNQWIDLDADERVNFALSVTNKISQKEMLQWAVDTFGPIASDKEERVKRFAEEAIELCHACGMEYQEFVELAMYVFDKEKGDIPQEIGQVELSLNLLAEVNNEDVDRQLYFEFNRVRSFDREYWQARQNKKASMGLAGYCNE